MIFFGFCLFAVLSVLLFSLINDFLSIISLWTALRGSLLGFVLINLKFFLSNCFDYLDTACFKNNFSFFSNFPLFGSFLVALFLNIINYSSH